MPDIDLIKILDLLARSGDKGVRVDCMNGEVSVKFRKDMPIDQDLLSELRSNKAGLIEYFDYYKNEFNDHRMPEDHHSPDHHSHDHHSQAPNSPDRRSPDLMPDRHLVQLSAGNGGPPLFIVPGTGGKCGGYKLLSDCFAGEYSVYGFEMMGTQPGETPLKTIQEIAAQNIRWIRRLQPEGPYRLAGHSFGAFVMYEMTRQLETMGETPDFIAVLDQAITRLEGLPFFASKTEFVMKMTKDYFESFKIIAPPYPQWMEELKADLKKLSFDQLLPYIAAFTGKRLPHAVKVIDYVTRLINIRVYNDSIAYRPSGRIDAEVLVFRAADGDYGDAEQTLHWSSHARNVKVFMVPGDHHNMLLEDNPVAIARLLKQRMQHSKTTEH